MIRRTSIILSLLLLGSCACAIVPPIGNVPPPEILEQYLPTPLIPVDTAPGGSIGLLKYLPDGTQVEIAGKTVSGVIEIGPPIVFYVQESDRSAGIRATTEQTISLIVGNVVDVSGTLATVNGERVLQNAAVSTPTLTTSVDPLLISLANIGGGPAGYQPGVTLRVPSTGVSILDAIGINNIGLLAQIYGKVTYVSGDQTYFYVDDGSDVYFNSAITGGMDDNIGSDVWDGTTHEISGTIYKNLGVMVSIANLTTEMRNQIDENDFIGVAGIVGTRLDSENRVLPLLQPRSDADIASDPSTISLLSPGDRIVPELQYNLTCLPLPIAFDSAHSAQYPPRAYYFMGQGYLWTYSALHHAQKQLPVDPQDYLKPISNLTHGAGYWLRLSGPGVSYQAVDDDTTDRWISLPYAWYNLFGHPFNHDVLWGDIKVTDGKRMAGLEEAAWSLNWVCSVGVWWEPGPSSSRDIGLPEDYAFTETMQSWHAYHMYAAKPVALIVPGTTYPPGPGIPARGSILATVTDTSTPANPLIGARVYCKYGSALTELPNGTAQIQDLAPGEYLVTASAQGYKSKSQVIQTDPPVMPVFALESQSGITLSLTANPSRVRPDGISTSMITVYAADREGVPLSGKSVIVTTDFSTFQESGTNTVPGSTGDEGTLSAHLGPSLLQGIATVTATCEGQTASIQVQFRTIVYVKPGGTGGGSSWGNAKGTVQGGLTVAVSGNEVWVAQGTYQENILLPAGVGLYGGFDGTENVRIDRKPSEHETLLDGGLLTDRSVIRIAEGAGRDTMIDGFTIRNGSGTFIDNQRRGAGILCRLAAPTITNNHITNNKSTYVLYGGGLWLYNSPAPGALISGNTFDLNGTAVTYGGAIGSIGDSGTTITGNVMESNTANNGGGIWCISGTVEISKNTVRNNAASGTSRQGGGMFLQGTSGSISGNLISGNSGCTGGGIYADSAGSATLSSNVIWQNSAASGGAGVHLSSSPTNLVNNTIAYNTGNGIYCTNTSNPTIANNIVAFNSQYGVYRQTGTPTLSHNCAFGNTSGNYYSLTPDQYSISQDPKLASDGRHIQPNSPCINAGDDSAVQSGWLDIDGEPRQVDIPAVGTSLVDIGADESYECGYYYGYYRLALSTDTPYGIVGETVTITADVTDWQGQPVPPGVTVCFTISGGTITEINGISPPPSGCGQTDENGNVTAKITRDTAGLVSVTVQVANPCGTGETTEWVDIEFYPTAPVEIFFCIDSTGSMSSIDGDHRASESIAKFLNDMVSEGVYLHRLGGVKFNEPGDLNTEVILTGAPGQPASQLALLSQFTNVTTFINTWVNNGYSPTGGDLPELQLDALHLAAQDMNSHSTPGNPNRYIVLITDDVYHYLDDGFGLSFLTKDDMITELTDTGCRVYISLWEDYPWLDLYYQGLLVNTGEFDPCNTATTEMADKYPLARLRARIMGN